MDAWVQGARGVAQGLELLTLRHVLTCCGTALLSALLLRLLRRCGRGSFQPWVNAVAGAARPRRRALFGSGHPMTLMRDLFEAT